MREQPHWLCFRVDIGHPPVTSGTTPVPSVFRYEYYHTIVVLCADSTVAQGVSASLFLKKTITVWRTGTLRSTRLVSSAVAR